MGLDAVILALAALITAGGSLVGAVALGVKNLAEARATRGAAEHTARQVSPNHGSSLADAVHRIERTVDKLEADVRVMREEKAGDHIELRRRLGRVEEQLFPTSAPSPGGPRQ